MLKIQEDSTKKRITFVVDGYVDANEYKAAMSMVTKCLSDWGKAQILEEIQSFKGMPPLLLLDDIRFRLKHLHQFNEVAVVTDVKWLRTFFKAAAFLKKDLRCFDISDKAMAIIWLDEAVHRSQ